MTRRARLLAVVAIVASGALGVISATQTWLLVTLADGGAELLVAGAVAVPVLAPLSLAVLALGLALSIAGMVLRYVFGVLTIAAGVMLTVVTGQVVVARPASAVAPAVTDATGIAGADAVASLVAAIEPTPWPVVTLAGWIVLLAAGIFTLATAHRWRGSGRRFRTDASPERARAEHPASLDAIDSWDGLSRGEDPTAPGRHR